MATDEIDDRRHILIAGPPYRGYLDMIGRAFSANGLRTSILEWQYPKRNLLQDSLYYASKRFRFRLARTQDEVNTAAIEESIKRLSPDYLLVMKNARLSTSTLNHCADCGVTRILWAYDNVRGFPQIAEAARDYDLVYTYEPSDVEILSRTAPSKFLPMAYDPIVYFPKSGERPEKWDVSFIGAVRDTNSRKRTLQIVADAFPGARVGVWTDTIHWYSHRRLNDLRFVGPRKNLKLIARTLEHAQINEIYNHSSVCLNIHHPQSVSAPNPRSFEILGSGSLLVTDRKLDALDGFESGEGYLHYSSSEELMDTLTQCLADPEKRARIASKGLSIVKEKHRFIDRAGTILDDIERQA